jgi:hypothetical protein
MVLYGNRNESTDKFKAKKKRTGRKQSKAFGIRLSDNRTAIDFAILQPTAIE